LTWAVPGRRLDDVFGSRLIAVITLSALATSPLVGTHVHRYADHDHPEHHHGPALHSHEGHRDRHALNAAGSYQLAPCDPADHEVALQAACGTAVYHHEGMLAVLDDGPGTSERPDGILIRLADVRVHGPPARTRTRPRAPPVVHPA
jgi:hypothetical protein